MFENLIVPFGHLAGVAFLIAAFVNVAKTFGLPDGAAPKLSAALSVAAFVAFAYLRIFHPVYDVMFLDEQAAQVGRVALYLLGFAVQMGLPAQFHKLLKSGSLPVIGTSHGG